MDELIARLEKHRAMSAKAENEFSKGVAEGIQFTLDLLRIELHNQHLKAMGWIK